MRTVKAFMIAALAALGLAPALAQGIGPSEFEALTGTYGTTITREDVEAQNCVQDVDLIGNWEIEIDAAGIMTFRFEPLRYQPEEDFGGVPYQNRHVYLIDAGQLKLGAGSGKHLCCLAGVPVNGVYEWTADSESLEIVAIEDLCLARRVVLTAHPFVRMGP